MYTEPQDCPWYSEQWDGNIPVLVSSTPATTLQGEDAMGAIEIMIKATSGRVNAVFDFANSTNARPEDGPLWIKIFG